MKGVPMQFFLKNILYFTLYDQLSIFSSILHHLQYSLTLAAKKKHVPMYTLFIIVGPSCRNNDGVFPYKPLYLPC